MGKDPDVGKDWGQKKKKATEDELIDSITDSTDMNRRKLQKTVKDRAAWCATVPQGSKESRHNLNDWTTSQLYWEADFLLI